MRIGATGAQIRGS